MAAVDDESTEWSEGFRVFWLAVAIFSSVFGLAILLTL